MDSRRVTIPPPLHRRSEGDELRADPHERTQELYSWISALSPDSEFLHFSLYVRRRPASDNPPRKRPRLLPNNPAQNSPVPIKRFPEASAERCLIRAGPSWLGRGWALPGLSKIGLAKINLLKPHPPNRKPYPARMGNFLLPAWPLDLSNSPSPQRVSRRKPLPEPCMRASSIWSRRSHWLSPSMLPMYRSTLRVFRWRRSRSRTKRSSACSASSPIFMSPTIPALFPST